MKKARPLIIIIACLAILIVGNFIYKDYFTKPEIASGGTEHNVSGWGWSDYIGWISFNSTSGGGSYNYGINVDFGTGNFSGYAWSDNVGWITFAPVGPYPADPQRAAHLESDYKVTGWARAVACQPSGCSGGWDGWIKLGDSTGSWTGAAQDQVRIDANTNEFEGWAWGSEVIGWIAFNCLGPPDVCGD
ncbi:MAG: hypothetical protein A2V69_02015 [Candidatus Portnoybacteria bacterium RBG_13_40_8]|uniref:Uncharacterized protein n=1 Tax=Candidatus Portnoybacteria bacterium RBG_13_40_8 TaxID=1801990 RepID=A0A1G2F1U0_9BACT|nr:MAG: hypothetical protein A2V69_02015 [Candidatus Portnoybacteria bacterium RBG_13_40_8]